MKVPEGGDEILPGYVRGARVEIKSEPAANLQIILTNLGSGLVTASFWAKPDPNAPGIPEDGLLARIPLRKGYQLTYTVLNAVRLVVEAEGESLDRYYTFERRFRCRRARVCPEISRSPRVGKP